MLVRVIRITAPWILLLFFICSWGGAQDAPPRLEVFAEGGGSFLSNGELGAYCNVDSLFGCSYYSHGFSYGARLFAGARFRFTSHDAIEASYSYSPNSFSFQPNRSDLISFNYVRYLDTHTPFQPFATAGVGADRFGGSTASTLSSYNGFRFAGNYGAGADIILTRHVALRLELRDYVGGQPSFATGTSHDLVPSGGIVFRFK
jgi:opacity protein-like surface antigen